VRLWLMVSVLVKVPVVVTVQDGVPVRLCGWESVGLTVPAVRVLLLTERWLGVNEEENSYVLVRVREGLAVVVLVKVTDEAVRVGVHLVSVLVRVPEGEPDGGKETVRDTVGVGVWDVGVRLRVFISVPEGGVSVPVRERAVRVGVGVHEVTLRECESVKLKVGEYGAVMVHVNVAGSDRVGVRVPSLKVRVRVRVVE